MEVGIKWENLRVTIPYVMGKLSEKKVSSIINDLRKNGFEQANLVMANPSAAAITLINNQKSLIIEPQHITYATKLEGEFDLVAIQTQFESILNSLLIDDKNQYLFDIEGISEAEDSHTNSREIFGQKYVPLDDEIYGVGYRFLIKNDKLFGEFKVEPHVSDETRYYYQWLLNKAEDVTIAEMLSDVKMEIEKNRDGCYSVIGR